ARALALSSSLALILLTSVQPAPPVARKARIAIAPILVQENVITVSSDLSEDYAELASKRESHPGGRNRRRLSSRFLLRQIVHLQSNRIRARAFDSVDHLDHIAIGQRPRRFNEYGLFNALIFGNVRRCLHADFIGVLFAALLERLLQL